MLVTVKSSATVKVSKDWFYFSNFFVLNEINYDYTGNAIFIVLDKLSDTNTNLFHIRKWGKIVT